jgi:hypothetical protein
MKDIRVTLSPEFDEQHGAWFVYYRDEPRYMVIGIAGESSAARYEILKTGSEGWVRVAVDRVFRHPGTARTWCYDRIEEEEEEKSLPELVEIRAHYWELEHRWDWKILGMRNGRFKIYHHKKDGWECMEMGIVSLKDARRRLADYMGD